MDNLSFSGWWLSFNPSEKYDFVGMMIPNWKNNPVMFQSPPTRNGVNENSRKIRTNQQATWEFSLIQIHDKSWEFLPNGDSLTDSWWLKRLGVLVPSAFRASGSV